MGKILLTTKTKKAIRRRVEEHSQQPLQMAACCDPCVCSQVFHALDKKSIPAQSVLLYGIESDVSCILQQTKGAILSVRNTLRAHEICPGYEL